MIIYGKIKDVRSITTQSGKDATIIDVACNGQWDAEKKAFGPEIIKSVWYFDNEKAKLALWSKDRTKDIGKAVVLSARESLKDGKVTYFGSYLPVTYGVVHNPAELKPDVSSDDQMAATTAVEDCQDAGELPEEMEVDFTSATSIASVISVLSASESTVAKDAVAALKKLVWPEGNAYIGKVGYAARSGKVFRVSFVTPNSEPAEWNSVSFFNEIADRAEKVIHKGDNVVLFLGEKKEFNGQPSYAAYNFIKLQ